MDELEPADAGPRIGSDEWVARVAGHTEHRGPLRSLWQRLAELPDPAGFALFVVAAATLPLFTSNGYVLRVGFNTLLYMLLAMGLNVVVGWAGLLDLGYVAFFGFGAYGYAMLASSQFNIHWPTLVVIPLVTLATALLGLLVALPSRRLSGDYLAIVTLFFGQLFVTVVNNGESMSLFGFTRDVNVTGGPDGIVNIDPFHVFGHELETLQSYYWVALGFFAVVLAVLYLVNDSRIGRAWRSLREDPLAAELMGMPVNRLKLQAFAVSAAVGGLTGTLFASLNTAVFSTDFSTDTLIIVYAMLILGGSGSLWGAILGAIVVDVSLEVLRTTNHATLIFVVIIVATLIAKLRPWRVLALVLAATVGLGFAVRAIVGAIWPFALHTQGGMTGTLGRIVAHWLPATTNYHVGNYAFLLLIAAVLTLTVVRPLWRNILLPPTLVLSVYVWNSVLAPQPSVTRLIFIGALLIVLMNVRPQGLVGSTRVEIV